MTLYEPGVSTQSADAVAVFDQNFRQVFGGARPIKALIKEASKPMDHPLEDGAVITDHRILLPVEIALDVVLPSATYRETYPQIKQLYDRAAILTVQTRARAYPNMFLYEIPHEEDPDRFDMLTMPIKLRQVQLVTAQTGLTVQTVRNPNNSSTVDRGQQQPGNSGSILSQVFR